MNYYDKDGSYIASDLPLDLPKVTEKEYKARLEKEQKISEYKQELKEIDEKSTRSIRAKLSGTATEEDVAYLANLETQAAEIRQKIKDLETEEVQEQEILED